MCEPIPAVHHHAHHGVWQRGGYDMNIWSDRKRVEKLNYTAMEGMP
jgi:hypothetical protein